MLAIIFAYYMPIAKYRYTDMILTVISPAKKLDYASPVKVDSYSQPRLLEHSKELLKELKKLSPQDVCALMGLSDTLGALSITSAFRNGRLLSILTMLGQQCWHLKATSIKV